MRETSYEHRVSALSLVALVGALAVATAFAAALSATTTNTEQSALGPGPGTYKILSNDGIARIPFEIVRSEIRMYAVINSRPVRMLIDNGYLWDQLLMFGSPRVDSLGLVYDGKIDVGGSGAGEPVESNVASGVTVSFPGVEFYDQTAIVTPYIPGQPNMWPGEGQVSAAFFKHFVVDVNFDDLVLSLIEPGEFEYTGGGVEVPLRHLQSGAWGIPGRLVMADGSVITRLLMLDIGLNDALLFVTNGPARIPLPEKTIATSLGFGMQGETVGHVGRVRRVDIGGYELDDVLANFSTAADCDDSDYDDAMIGFALLKQFNLVFDYPHQRMFLGPNKHYGEAQEFDMSGLELRPGNASLVVRWVVPVSPAAEAGLREGDVITAINGVPARQYRSFELHDLFRKPGNTVTLEYSRDGGKREVTIVLRRLL